MTISVDLPRIGTFQAWRRAARQLLAAGTPPEDVRFEPDPGLFPAAPLPPARGALPDLRLSRAALGTLENALCHSDPLRFERAYALIWRLAGRDLRFGDRSDPAMRKLLAQAREVRRDIHKMHAFVRFREGPPRGSRRAFAAWFEPTHRIAEAAAPFFARRFGDMDWMIRTPDVTAIFRDGSLGFEETGESGPPPADATEALWCTYYAAIFNPARLMVPAMQSEMPLKYWKNLPETRQIPTLIRTAPARAQEMADRAPAPPPAFAASIARRRQGAPAEPAPQGLDQIARAARACDRCRIGASATQLVWGEGPKNANLFIVGEQPGDQEDLAGRPLVGPAGQVFDQAAAAGGLDRSAAYLTNAVKHFKFSPRGKRRLHQRPDAGEIEACKWWLDLEIRHVRPRLLIALGATAARALTGVGVGITRRRGRVEIGRHGLPVLLTLHPAAILRLDGETARHEAARAFEADLRTAVRLVETL